MRSIRFVLPILSIVIGLSVLAGAGRRGKSETCPASPAPAPIVDAAASHLLDDALAAVDRIGWVEMSVRQEVHLPSLEYRAEGRFRAAGDDRYQLEMEMHVGKTTRVVVVVADGKSVWRAAPTGDGVWKDVHRVKTGPAADAPVEQGEFLRGPAFSGPRSLLRDLRQQLVWVKREAVSVDGSNAVELTGVWKPEAAKAFAAKDAPWPEGMPDRCRLLLDADTLWPRRVEWWGPAGKGQGTALLAKLELRNPILNRAPLRAECARLLTFDPGNADVIEEMKTVGDAERKKP